MAWMSIEKAARKYLHCRPETLKAFVAAGYLTGAHVPVELLESGTERRTTLVNTAEIDALLLASAPQKDIVTSCLAEDALMQRKDKYFREFLGRDAEEVASEK